MPYCPECSASTPEGANRCPTCGAALVATPTTESQPGTAIHVDVDALQIEIADSITPQYELLKPLGAGGMGAVFLAREPALKRLVAVKVLTPQLASDSRVRARFEREARTAAALSHPNIVRVYAVGETRSQRLPYIVMQFVQGPTLASWMTQRRRVGERDARRVIGEVASALAAAHVRDLVHRDIKPSNVLLEADTGRPFVVDFGVSAALSRASDETKLTVTGAVIGTPVYMSPEQASGDAVSTKSDVYSLGVMAYELLTGEPPFQASTAMGWAAAHLRDTPTPVGQARKGLSPELARLVDRCLSKDPTQRPTAADVARGFLPTLDSEIEWPPPGLAPLRGLGRQLNRLALAVAASGLWVLFALAFTPELLRVHPNWLDAYGALREAMGPDASAPLGTGASVATSVFLWEALTILGGAAFLLSLFGLVVVSIRAIGSATRYLQLGWHPLTVFDVVVDDDGQSGLLLAGSREFASLDVEERRRVVYARRFQTAAATFAGAWVAVTVVGWFVWLTVFGAAAGHGPSTGPALWYVGTVPVLLAAAAGVIAAILEARLLGPLRRRRRYEASIDEVKGWYGRLPPDLKPSPRLWAPGRRSVRALQIGVVVAGLIAALVLAESVIASIVAGEVTSRTGQAAADLRATLTRLHAEDPLGRLRQLLEPYMPPRDLPNDSAARAWARALMDAPGIDTFPPIQVSLPRMRTGREGVAVTEQLMREAQAGRIPPDSLRPFERLASHPRLAALGRLARVDSLSFFYAWLDQPLDQYDSWWRMRLPRIGGVRLAITANVGVAAMAAGLGRYREAEQRLGENAAIMVGFLAEPYDLAGLVAVQGLQASVLGPLAVLEEARGRPEQARRLRDVGRDLQFLQDAYNLPAAVGFAADPRDMSSFVTLLSDSTLPAGWRIDYLGAAWVGACTNPRELLFGLDTSRRETAMRAAAVMTGVANASLIASMTLNDFESYPWIGEPARGPFDRLRQLMPWNAARSLGTCASVQ